MSARAYYRIWGVVTSISFLSLATIAALAAFLVPAPEAGAATHEVSAYDEGSSQCPPTNQFGFPTEGCFVPETITVQVGDTVNWTNKGPSKKHDVTAEDGSFSSGDMIPVGGSWPHTFSAAGEFIYYCSVHSDQTGGTRQGQYGKVVVQAGGGGTTTTTQAASTPTTVAAGGAGTAGAASAGGSASGPAAQVAGATATAAGGPGPGAAATAAAPGQPAGTDRLPRTGIAAEPVALSGLGALVLSRLSRRRLTSSVT